MELKSIHKIFTDRILRIPSYQRGYSWGNNKTIDPVEYDDLKNVNGQLMDLWNDIINIPEGGWHYTGLLTLVATETRDYDWLKHYEQFAIVDGQQRITTILILIAVILEKAEELNLTFGARPDDEKYKYLYVLQSKMKAYIFGYDKDNPSDKFFRIHILNINEIVDESKESLYTENLRNAKYFFNKIVQLHIDKAEDATKELNKLFNTVTCGLKMNEYILPKELNQYVVFETMNNRGKPLSELEKLKNRLMFLVDKIKVDDPNIEKAYKLDLEKKINTGWISIYQALGAKKESPLDDEDFVKNHWIAYFDSYKRSEANVYANFLFKEYFTLEQIYDNKLSDDDILKYVQSLQNCAGVWNKINHPEYFSKDENLAASYVNGLHRVNFVAPFKPIVLAALCHNEKTDYLEIVKLLKSYAFKIFHVSDRQSNTGNTELYKLAFRVYNSKVSAIDACNIIKKEMEYYYSFQKFRDLISDCFETGNKKGFYDWNGLRYFLFEYDLMLRKVNKTTTRGTELQWEEKNTIEHIFPQSAAKSYLEFCDGNDTAVKDVAYKAIKNNWTSFFKYSDEQRMRLCHSLGNLLPISNSDNASFNNDKFIFKVDQSKKGDAYINRGYIHDSMSAQLVAKNADWTPELVKERGLHMLKAMFMFLDEKCDLSEDEQISLLGLDFLIKKNQVK